MTIENSKTLGSFCGQRRGMVVNITGKYVLLTFHSDTEVQEGGFLLVFTALPLPGKFKISKNYPSYNVILVVILL